MCVYFVRFVGLAGGGNCDKNGRMKIGIVSDTHGEMEKTAEVVSVFAYEQVDMVIHCGDIGCFEVMAELTALEVPVHAVLGNCDLHEPAWRFFPDNIGVTLHGRMGELTVEGKQIAFIHGDDARAVNALLKSERIDYLFTGHTHQRHDLLIDTTRCINPGALVRSTEPTCAVLTLPEDELVYLRI
jgi:uncharacterized protein